MGRVEWNIMLLDALLLEKILGKTEFFKSTSGLIQSSLKLKIPVFQGKQFTLVLLLNNNAALASNFPGFHWPNLTIDNKDDDINEFFAAMGRYGSL